MHFLRNDGSIISHGTILMIFFHVNVNMLNLVSMSSCFFNKFVNSTELTKNMKEKTQAVLSVLWPESGKTRELTSDDIFFGIIIAVSL